MSPGIERRPLAWACRAGSTKLRKYYVRSAEGKRTVYDARLAIAVGTFFVEVHLMEATGVDDVVAAAAAIDVPSLVGSWR